ncbi:site-specific DNA-methyltransferase [Corynebacterium sp. H113]|uniref:site-specific DNA-methyltransferase n=1 Tax=Corynebacterium sp. H113 TaxID=3133419 RepID=UPI0030B773AE
MNLPAILGELVSRLKDLVEQVKLSSPLLGQELAVEIERIGAERTFGLVFERHAPEATHLYGRIPQRGDKVNLVPPRGVIAKQDSRLWSIVSIEGTEAKLIETLPGGASWDQVAIGREPATIKAKLDNLVVVAEHSDTIYPGLIETGRVDHGAVDSPAHVVINAENYHALEALTYTHSESVDCIYIDPPYNTGAKDWKYNNDYVQVDDDYRHSKWLAFMERRLLVAKELLNPNDSVLIVTIDEKEYLRLGLLLEQTFPTARQQMISSLINPAGAGRVADFSRTDEYIFVLQFGESKLLPMEREVENVPVVWDTLRRSSLAGARGRKGKGACGPNQFYPIYVNEQTGMISEIGEPISEITPIEDAPQREGCVAVFPIRPDGTEMNWGITPDVAIQRLKDGHLRAGQKKPNEPQKYVISYLTGGIVEDLKIGKAIQTGVKPDGSVIAHYPKGKDKMPTTQWHFKSHDAQRYGTEMVKDCLGSTVFNYPKSLYAVEDILRFFLKNKPQALVVDFFAGSGTTAHAVLRLNKLDKGSRRSLSITNNEVSASEQDILRKRGFRPGDSEWEKMGICDNVTKPRIQAAITGKTPSGKPIQGKYQFLDEFPKADGFEANARYFTLTYENPVGVSYGHAFERVAPMLWLRAGQVGEVIYEIGERGFELTDHYAVLCESDSAGQFVEAVNQRGSISHAFIVTDNKTIYQRIAQALGDDIESVQLYESYLTNFQINSGRKN